jgi:hypothetical protein
MKLSQPSNGVLLLPAVLVVVLTMSARAAADEPAGKFQVHEVSLWIIENSGAPANVRNMFGSPLPSAVNSTRFGQAATVNPGGNIGVFVPAGAVAPAPVRIDRGPAKPEAHNASSNRTAPFGLIAFHGEPAANMDIDLRIKSGSFLAHWPPAESLPNRLRWSGPSPVDLVATVEDAAALMLVDEEHWFTKARQGDALYIRRGARAERFIAYDAELKVPAPIKLDGGPEKFTVANTSNGPVYDVLIARKTPQGLRLAWLDVLPPSTPAKPAKADAAKAPVDLFGDGKGAKAPEAKEAKPVADKPAEQKDKPAEEKDKPAEQKEKPAEQAPAKESAGAAIARRLAAQGFLPKSKVDAALDPAKQQAAAKSAASQPKLTGVEVTLSDPLPPDSDEAKAKTVGSLSERLTRAGLRAHESQLIATHYTPLLFAAEGVVVACRLDAAQFDDHLQLSIFPEPAKVVRVPLVVMNNADPQLGSEVDQLVTQLGDPAYKVREAAQSRLVELGPLAFPALNKALNHQDLEVVIRAEKILLNQNQPAVGRQGVSNSQPAAAAAPAKAGAAPKQILGIPVAAPPAAAPAARPAPAK